jgi:RNA polymerase sigma-70 factor (ECF subfamily)
MPPRNPPKKTPSPSGNLVLLRAAPGDPDPAWQLVEAVRRGNAGALDALVAALAPHVLRAVNALAGRNHCDVEDLAQEALLAVVDALPSFRGESTLLHFAIRITTRRMVRARRRSHSVLRWLEEHWRTSVPLFASPRNPHDASLDERRRALLIDLLATLPKPQSEALMLRTVLGLSVEEVAAVARVPQNTVRSRLRLAKVALRHKIAATPDAHELLALAEVP